MAYFYIKTNPSLQGCFKHPKRPWITHLGPVGPPSGPWSHLEYPLLIDIYLSMVLVCKNHVFEALNQFLPLSIFHLPKGSVNHTSGAPKAPSKPWHHLKYPPNRWLIPSMILDISKSCCQNQYLWKLEHQCFYKNAISEPPLSCESIYLIHSKRQ